MFWKLVVAAWADEDTIWNSCRRRWARHLKSINLSATCLLLAWYTMVYYYNHGTESGGRLLRSLGSLVWAQGLYRGHVESRRNRSNLLESRKSVTSQKEVSHRAETWEDLCPPVTLGQAFMHHSGHWDHGKPTCFLCFTNPSVREEAFFCVILHASRACSSPYPPPSQLTTGKNRTKHGPKSNAAQLDWREEEGTRKILWNSYSLVN